MRLALYMTLATVLAIALFLNFPKIYKIEDVRTSDLAFVIELYPDRAPNSYLLPGGWFTSSQVLGVVGTPVYVDIFTKYDFHDPEFGFASSTLDLSGDDPVFIICLPDGFYAISENGFEDCQPYSPEGSAFIVTYEHYSFEDHVTQIWGDWGYHIARSTDYVRHVVDMIESGNASDDPRYIRGAYNWVQDNLSYTSEVPYHTATPDIADILSHKTTDCKGYSALLATLLYARGIESELVLVRVRDHSTATTDYLLGGYDHLVLYLPDYDAYLDPTVPGSRPGELYVSSNRSTGYNLIKGTTVDLSEKR